MQGALQLNSIVLVHKEILTRTMQGALQLPLASSEPGAVCTQRNQDVGNKQLPAVRLPQLSKATSGRLATLRRSASVESYLLPTNVADDQVIAKGPPKKVAYRKRNIVPCQSPPMIRGSTSSTLDSSFSQNESFSRTKSVDSLLTNSKGATLKEPSKMGLSFRRAAAQAAHIKNFTKSIRSSVDSFQDQIRATYESCERARSFLARSDTDQTSVLSPHHTLNDLLAKDEFRRRIQESPGVCERGGFLSKSSDFSPVMWRGNTGQLVIKSALFFQSPAASPRRAFHRPEIQPPQFLGNNLNPNNSNSTFCETETPSVLDCIQPDRLPLLEFGSPILRYLPGVGQRIVRIHKHRVKALVVPNGLSVDLAQPDQHSALCFSRTRSEPSRFRA